MNAAPRRDEPSEAQGLVRRAAVAVIIEKGLGGFSIREVARRAGVSHAAPGYFFGDMQGLLTSLAVEGFETLRNELTSAFASTTDPIARLAAIGRAYVHVALSYPAHCEVMFREDVINVDDAEFQTVGLQAYGLLEETIKAIADKHNPALDVETAARLCWSAMQGLVQLTPKLARMDLFNNPESTPTEETVDRFTKLLVTGLIHSER